MKTESDEFELMNSVKFGKKPISDTLLEQSMMKIQERRKLR